MSAQLTVHNAEIKTATVEVRTLTISGKQVTLAVFRQLQERPMITEVGGLAGPPWGIVNYHPDKCVDRDPHIHIVWQDGADLRRSLVWVPDEATDAKRKNALKDLERKMRDGSWGGWASHAEVMRVGIAEHERHYACLIELADLPQLFIAV